MTLVLTETETSPEKDTLLYIEKVLPGSECMTLGISDDHYTPNHVIFSGSHDSQITQLRLS